MGKRQPPFPISLACSTSGLGGTVDVPQAGDRSFATARLQSAAREA